MTKAKPTLLFMGTPEFAVPSLCTLAETNRYEIVGVLCQPDKPVGRGNKLTPPPVKVAAQQLDLEVFQPKGLKKLEAASGESGKITFSGPLSTQPLAEKLNSLGKIDANIVVAYGKILPMSLVNFPRIGSVNIHPSLLPRWRGAAPIHHAVFHGDAETGVAIMQIDDGLDTGPVYSIERTAIKSGETYGELCCRLAESGAEQLVRLLPDILDGSLKPTPQGEQGATYAEKWDKDDLVIRWEEPADVTCRRILTCAPDLGARTRFEGSDVKVYAAQIRRDPTLSGAAPGSIVEVNKAELIVSTGSCEHISIIEMQFPGKNKLSIADVLRGRQFEVGQQFG